MQVCTSLQTDNHASTSPLFFTGRMPFLPPNQQRQSTEGATQKANTKKNTKIQTEPLQIKTKSNTTKSNMHA